MNIIDVLSEYSWFELWGPGWLMLTVLAGRFYVKGVVWPEKYLATGKQCRCFFTAIVLFYLVRGSPFAVLAGDYLFSAYSLQQAVLYLVVPPLIIIGLPIRELRPFLWRYPVKRVLKLLTYPWTTTFLFTAGFSVYHVPFVFNAVSKYPVLSVSGHLFLLFTAFLMWWSIISPLPELNRLSGAQRVAYIFVNGISLTPICMLLLLSNSVLFPAYAQAPRVVPLLSAVYDQQLGGGIIKMFQLASYGTALAVIVYRWVKRDVQPRTDPAESK